MGGLDYVVFGFAAVRISRQAALLAQGFEVLPPGDQLVHVGLVSGIEDDGISWGIEDSVDPQCQFDDSEVWAQMPTGTGDIVDEEVADFICQVVELFEGKRPQVAWFFDGLQ